MAENMTVEDVRKHVRVYLYVFIALGVLTAVTVAASYLDVSFYPALVIALLIACVKASLVAAYFMHLINEKRVVMGVLISTMIFLICMFVLMIASYADQEQLASLLACDVA